MLARGLFASAPSKAASALSLGLLLLAAGTPGARAEVSFDTVEQALVALENAAAAALSGAAVEATVEAARLPDSAQAPDLATTLPPADAVPAEAVATSDPLAADGFVFLPILSDVACPSSIAEITSKAEGFAALSTRIRTEAAELGGIFEKLEKESASLRKEGVVVCPPRFVAKVEDLLNALSRLEITPHAQAAETLSACAQTGRQGVERRISELSESTDVNETQTHLALGQALAPWGDRRRPSVRAVGDLISFDRRSLVLGF